MKMIGWYAFMNTILQGNRMADVNDWADLRVFLAVNDGQTLLSAAEILGMSQPTVGRRLASFEARLGVQLFVRTGRRMVLTDSGGAILEGARKMEREMNAIRRTLDGQIQGLCGEVTISATEGTGSQWLIPVMASLQKKYPDIHVELNIDFRSVDLLGREADLALRLGRPSQLDLIARKLTDIEFGIYASKDYLRQLGPIETLEDLSRTHWVRGLFGVDQRDIVAEFIGRTGASEHFGLADYHIAMTTNSPTTQLAAVGAGMGVGALSHRWASTNSELVNLLPELTMASYELWLVTHEGLRHSARIKAVADHIAEAAQMDKGLFSLHGGAGD